MGSKKPAGSVWGGLRESMGSTGRSALALLLLVAVGLGSYTLWSLAASKAQNLPRYRLSVKQIELEPAPPAWVRGDVLGELRQFSSLSKSMSVLDPALVDKVAAAFGAHPWIEQVEEVTKAYPNRVRVRVKYRGPVAAVRTPTGLAVVDRNGVLLPGERFSPEELAAYLLLDGVSSTPSGPPGTSWGDSAVTAGAKTADFLGPQRYKLGLRAVDVSGWEAGVGTGSADAGRADAEMGTGSPNRTRGTQAGQTRGAPTGAAPGSRPSEGNQGLWTAVRGSASSSGAATPATTVRPEGAAAAKGVLYLISAGGTRVVWGRPPDETTPSEVSAQEKLRRLIDYVAKNGSLEKPAGPYELDVRHWEELTRRPRWATVPNPPSVRKTSARLR